MFILFRFTALVRRLELKSGNISSFWFVVLSWRFQRPLGIHKIYWSRLLAHLFRLANVYLSSVVSRAQCTLGCIKFISSPTSQKQCSHRIPHVIVKIKRFLFFHVLCFTCPFKKKPEVVIWLAIYSLLLLFIQNIAPFLNGFDPPTSFPGSSPTQPPWPRGPSRRGPWERGCWSTG